MQADVFSDVSVMPRPVVGLFRDDCVELVDGDDAILLYNHGFYGKGTVSRRNPNKGFFNVVLPWNAQRAGVVAGGTAGAASAGREQQLDDGDDNDEDNEGGNTGVADLAAGPAPPGPAVLSARLAASCLPLPAEEDVLSRSAEAFDERVASVPLPEAYAAAAYAAAHGQDETDFETARQTAHYVSCPPPRLRTAPAGAAGEGGPSAAAPSGPAAANERAAQETSLLEPEAVMYLALRHPGKLLVYMTPTQGAMYSPVIRQALVASSAADAPGFDLEEAVVAALAQPLDVGMLWRIFCARVPDFPARLAVYMRFRDEGWVVREGHAFGADFVLYTAGPGIDHAVHCVTVGPLRVVPHLKQAAEPAPAAAAASYVRAPTRRVMGSWVDMHALSRVVSSVKKHSLIAHVTLHLEVGSLEAVQGPRQPQPPLGRSPQVYMPVDGKPLAAIPIALRVSPVAQAAALPSLPEAGEPGSAAAPVPPPAAPAAPPLRQPFYSGAIAAWLSSPACISSLAVSTAAVDRWSPMLEGVKKTSALMSHIAAAASRAEAENGLKINLTALVANNQPRGTDNSGAGVEEVQPSGQGADANAEAGEGADASVDAATALLSQPLRPLCSALSADALLLHAWGYTPALVDAVTRPSAAAAGVASSDGAGGASAAPAPAPPPVALAKAGHPNKAEIRYQVRQLLMRQNTGVSDGAGDGMGDGVAASAAAGVGLSSAPGEGSDIATAVEALVLTPTYDSTAPSNLAATAVILQGLCDLHRDWRVIEALGEAGRLRPAAMSLAASAFRAMPRALGQALHVGGVPGGPLCFRPWAPWLTGGAASAEGANSGGSSIAAAPAPGATASSAALTDDGGVFCRSVAQQDVAEAGSAVAGAGAPPLGPEALPFLASDPSAPACPPLALSRALEAHAPFISQATAQFQATDGAVFMAALEALQGANGEVDAGAPPPAKRPRLQPFSAEHEQLVAAALAALYPAAGGASDSHAAATSRPRLSAPPLRDDCALLPGPPDFGLHEPTLARIAAAAVPASGPGAGPEPAAGPALKAWRRERHQAVASATGMLASAVVSGSVAARRAAGLSAWMLPQRAWSHATLLDKAVASEGAESAATAMADD